MGFLGTHFVRTEWRSTFVPISFCVSRGETIPAVNALVGSTIEHIQHNHALDLIEHTVAVYLDGGPALLHAFNNKFPTATTVRCVEHVKKDITKNGAKWKYKNHG